MIDPAADSPPPQSEFTVPQAPSAQPAAAANEPAGGPGARLMAERRAQGLSLGDVARRLKLSVRQVEALERDDHAAFSGVVFVRGFVRNYAKLLRLDPDSLLTQLPGPAPAAKVAGSPAPAALLRVPEPRERRPRSFGVLGAVAILVVLVLAALYEGRQRQPSLATPPGVPSPVGASVSPQHADSPPPGLVAAPAATPTQSPIPALPPRGTAVSVSPSVGPANAGSTDAAPTLASPPVASLASAPPEPRSEASAAAVAQVPPSAGERSSVGGARVRLVFEDEAWVEIKDRSGTVIFSRLNSAGTERSVTGQPPLSVIVGNAHGVRVMYRDQAVDLAPHTRVDVARVVLE